MIPLKIETLYGGGAVERLQEEIQRVIANICDPNTPAKKVRKIKKDAHRGSLSAQGDIPDRHFQHRHHRKRKWHLEGLARLRFKKITPSLMG